MIVVFTREAEDSLERIGDYIAQDNPQRALTFIEEVRSAALALADFPTAYPLVSRYSRLGVRRRVHGNYLIIFQIVRDRIVILSIVGGAQDYDRLITPEG